MSWRIRSLSMWPMCYIFSIRSSGVRHLQLFKTRRHQKFLFVGSLLLITPFKYYLSLSCIVHYVKTWYSWLDHFITNAQTYSCNCMWHVKCIVIIKLCIYDYSCFLHWSYLQLGMQLTLINPSTQTNCEWFFIHLVYHISH
jgi:hypothetical protein